MSLSTFAKKVSISGKERLGACLVSFFILGGASGCSVSVLESLLSSFSERLAKKDLHLILFLNYSNFVESLVNSHYMALEQMTDPWNITI